MKWRDDRPPLRVTYVCLGNEEYAVISIDGALQFALPDGLTSAEGDVVTRVLSGASNAEIGRARGTSSRTVANQMASVFRKLGVQSRAELARLCAALVSRGVE